MALLPIDLTTDLALLSVALDQPDIDLRDLLASFLRESRRSVRSIVAVTITMVVGGHPYDIAAGDQSGHDVAVTSAMLPLTAMFPCEPGTEIIFYASVPGALVDLAADLAYLLRVELDTIVMDEHLPPMGGASRHSLSNLRDVNVATGMLIERGRTPEDADATLRELAEAHGITVPAAARLLIAEPR